MRISILVTLTLIFMVIGISCSENEIVDPTNKPPSSPRNLRATVDSSLGKIGEVKLTWELPSSNGGSPISQYIVYKGTNPNNLAIIYFVDGSITSYTDTNNIVENTYFFAVSAKNEYGESSVSNVIIISSLSFSKPSAPRDFLCSVDFDRILLTWSPPLSDGGAPIINYRIYRGNSSNNLQLYVTLSNQLASYLDTSVLNQNTYFYKISASNFLYEGELSETDSVFLSAVPPRSISGIVTFVDTNFTISGGLYLISAYPAQAWPPTGGPSAYDTIAINPPKLSYTYRLFDLYPGSYVVSVGFRKNTGGQSPLLSVYGCDTARFIYGSTCFLNPPRQAIITHNNQGAEGIDMISWADTSKRVY